MTTQLTPEQIKENAAEVADIINQITNRNRSGISSVQYDRIQALANPWTFSRHLPGFDPLGEWQEWHRNDFTRDMLPEGWRPCLKNEPLQVGDEYRSNVTHEWEKDEEGGGIAHPDLVHHRTRRPLPSPKPAPRPWSKPEDVPGPVCWVRTDETDKYPCIITGFTKSGVGIDCDGNRHVTYAELSTGWQYSTTRQPNDWHKCEVKEEGK